MSPKEQAEAVRQAMQILKADGHPGEALWEAVVRIAKERDQARAAFLQVEEERDEARALVLRAVNPHGPESWGRWMEEVEALPWVAAALAAEDGITRDPDPRYPER